MYYSKSIQTYPSVAFAVHVITIQLTCLLVRFKDASKFPITCHMEASIGGQHQKPCAVSPADLILCMIKKNERCMTI